ncbi:sigma factor-like helix-turn-helix DNA-binding protein [Streptomyces sp. NBC_00236]|uniref:sigma factor-like helix-turn-helix DNA-binding protein n=1 Tax=unclassified Streptomyces TaxID=2593676 RepID=UPI002E295944|nr:sigma factor-like helix-turn-helix DNA-binding protein [Streptomyces sp. NBC_00236]
MTPSQRVAYVLHDLFSVPFDRIAHVLGGTVPSAKKHASRARQRLDGAQDASERNSGPDQRIVEAFLTAARTGDTRRMIQLLAPDSVRDADAALLPRGARTAVLGAVDIANETVHFRDRIRSACRLTVNDKSVYLIAPGGHPLATIEISTAKGKVTRIAVRSAQADDRFAAALRSTSPTRNNRVVTRAHRL